jgi:hypothetical protein
MCGTDQNVDQAVVERVEVHVLILRAGGGVAVREKLRVLHCVVARLCRLVNGDATRGGPRHVHPLLRVHCARKQCVHS